MVIVSFESELIHYSYLVQQKFPGSEAVLGILRAGEKMEIKVNLVHIPELVPATMSAVPE